MEENKFIRFVRKYIVYILSFFLLLLLFLIYRYTNIFTIQNISVFPLGKDKLSYITDDEINNTVSKYKGVKYFKVKTLDAQTQIQSISPFVKSVLVFKEFPNTLSVHVLERIPFVTLKINNVCVLLDLESFVLKDEIKDCEETSIQYSTLLVKSDDPKLQFIQGNYSNYHQLDKILQVTKVLNENKLGVNEVTISENIANFKVSNNKIIRISFNQNIEVELTRLVAIFNELGKKNYRFTLIDVRSERPTLK